MRKSEEDQMMLSTDQMILHYRKRLVLEVSGWTTNAAYETESSEYIKRFKDQTISNCHKEGDIHFVGITPEPIHVKLFTVSELN